ncbi:hypothetical protein [Nocardiopsis quinghaiensis]|uniref:hypothetical protein n=1 Tax=Nocardiopsis quinghaiensis TaxID=464995 RepID=UPI00123B9822|nr:hypothetical protein [Nocardiopsis quinghaiensis]
MIQLPHTGMLVPHTDIRVTYVTETGVGEGVSALVENRSQTLGFLTLSARRDFVVPEMSKKHRWLMERFADQCRDSDGHPLPHGDVWDLLVAERYYQQAVDEARREQRVLVRVFSRTGLPKLHSVGAHGPVPPGAERQVYADLVRDLGPDDVRAEVWIAGQWRQIHPGPRDSRPSG